MRLAIALLGWTLLAGCFDNLLECSLVNCSPCPPSIFLVVQDSTGRPIPGAAVAGVEAPCQTDRSTGSTLCQARVPPGSYQLTVSAAGFASRTVTVEVSAAPAPGGLDCCGSCATGGPSLIELVPAP
jgi:hypothetical protein